MHTESEELNSIKWVGIGEGVEERKVKERKVVGRLVPHIEEQVPHIVGLVEVEHIGPVEVERIVITLVVTRSISPRGSIRPSLGYARLAYTQPPSLG